MREKILNRWTGGAAGAVLLASALGAGVGIMRSETISHTLPPVPYLSGDIGLNPLVCDGSASGKTISIKAREGQEINLLAHKFIIENEKLKPPKSSPEYSASLPGEDYFYLYVDSGIEGKHRSAEIVPKGLVVSKALTSRVNVHLRCIGYENGEIIVPELPYPIKDAKPECEIDLTDGDEIDLLQKAPIEEIYENDIPPCPPQPSETS